MHFALPPRKSSNPPPYARSSKWNAYPKGKKDQMKMGAVGFCAVLLVFYFFLRIFSSSDGIDDRIPFGTPNVVIVTVLDNTMSKKYVDRIKENREDYAARHGELKKTRQAKRKDKKRARLISRKMQATKLSTLPPTTTTLASIPNLGPWCRRCGTP